MDIPLPSVCITPAQPPKASVIWLHGLGADGHDFENIVPELRLPEELSVRFVFPHAPRRPVTINGGYVMRAWYDIYHSELARREDETGIRDSEHAVCRLIEQEIRLGIPPAQIVLAGFSQGGAIALHTGLRYPQRLAGIMALSSYLPLTSTLAQEADPANARTPIMMAHGTEDPIVPLPHAQHSHQQLLKLGYAVEWHDYPMQHSVCQREIIDISAWLQRILRPAQGDN